MTRYFTIFAGRRRYLQLLTRYTDVLLAKGLIDEVQLWVFTTNPDDCQFIWELCQEKKGYHAIYPPEPEERRWGFYYHHQIVNTHDDDIIIKCDDDILYLDITRFECFLAHVSNDGLYFPNIVNNDVCAYFQEQHGIHSLISIFYPTLQKQHLQEKGNQEPLTGWSDGWYTRHDIACASHQQFLDNPASYDMQTHPIIEYGNRISINFFATTGKYFKQVFTALQPYGYNDDETWCGKIPELYQTHKIVPFFTVSHFQFGLQDGKELDKKYLARYETLASTSLASLT
jgi:hypothetical protein